MDTVGMSQLDAPDHEAIFQVSAYDAAKVDSFLRKASSYVLERGQSYVTATPWTAPAM